MLTTSQTGIDLIKHYEGVRLHAYKCAAGVLTIGYGHTSGVYPNMVISMDKAEELLKKDLARFEKAVNLSVKVPLTQSQFDALVSFTYNVGEGALHRSTLLKYINTKQFHLVPHEFLRWNRSGGHVMSGLTKRRKSEATLFQEGRLQFN